jgi:hypothetical protein
MRIGSSIALIALGLILALAVNLDVAGLDLNMIGWILTAVGIVGLLVSLVLARQTRPADAPRRGGVPPPTYPDDPRY